MLYYKVIGQPNYASQDCTNTIRKCPRCITLSNNLNKRMNSYSASLLSYSL